MARMKQFTVRDRGDEDIEEWYNRQVAIGNASEAIRNAIRLYMKYEQGLLEEPVVALLLNKILNRLDNITVVTQPIASSTSDQEPDDVAQYLDKLGAV